PLYLGKDDSVSHRQQRAFATIEWSASDNNVINVGALVEEHELSETEISPRVSLTHTFNRNHKIRFGVSQAKRGPFIFETMADQSFSQDLTSGGVPIPPGLGIPTSLYEQIILSDQDLKSEKITSREIAYFGEFLNSALLVNGRVFYDSISRYIDTLRESAPPGDNVPDDITDPASPNTMLVFYNVTESTTTGAEIELDYHIDSSLRLIASGALIHIRSDSDAASRSAPQRSYSFLVSKRFNNNYNSSLGYYFVEGFKWMDARGTDDYRILDLRLSRNFRSNWSNGSISLVLKNLLDDYSDYSSPPRNPTAPQVIQSTQAYIDFRLNF
ncbi:MAG: TonB-dependent receptor, partial [Proteobacteria bacterium]|nr:TonB-dependent receptor [Pseudomonadota bacterium]